MGTVVVRVVLATHISSISALPRLLRASAKSGCSAIALFDRRSRRSANSHSECEDREGAIKIAERQLQRIIVRIAAPGLIRC